MELQKDFKLKESTAIACKGSGADGEIPTFLTGSRVFNGSHLLDLNTRERIGSSR